MDFRLKVFISVADNNSFSKAAKELSLSQPAVTKHIQMLESIYGVQLFDRGVGFVKLTTRGEFFAKRARYILNGYDMLEFEMNAVSGYHTRSIRIGASTTIAEYILPKMIASYIDNNIGVKFVLSFGTSEELAHNLMDGELDMVFTEHVEMEKELVSTHFIKEEVIIAAKKGTSISEKLSLEQFRRMPLVIQEDSSDLSKFITQQLSYQQLSLSDLNILIRSKGCEGAKSFISNSSIALAILPYSAVKSEIESGKLESVQVEGIKWQRNLMLCYINNDFSPVAEELLKYRYI